MKANVVIVIVFVLVGVFNGFAADNSKLAPLSAMERAKFEGLARSYAPVLWTNDYSSAGIFASIKTKFLSSEECIRVRFIHEGKDPVEFNFPDQSYDRAVYVVNSAYSDPPFKELGKPEHTTKAQARVRAAAVSELFGVSNFWDEAHFTPRASWFMAGKWYFANTAVANGHQTLYGVSVMLVDDPFMNVSKWHSTVHEIPTNLPTNVVVTAAQAKTLADGYIEKYFPVRSIIPGLTFVTNRLEYVAPNYNYIRPADEGGLSNYEPGKDEIALVWAVHYVKPEPEPVGFFAPRHRPLLIYVDAATGEMLGGAD